MKEAIEKQSPLFRKLILDLEELVFQYTSESNNLFGICLMSNSDLDKWSKINPHMDKNLYFKKMDRFWGLNIGLTNVGLLISQEDLI